MVDDDMNMPEDAGEIPQIKARLDQVEARITESTMNQKLDYSVVDNNKR